MKLNRKALEQLLSATMREQHINGKAQPQVTSCVLRLKDGVVSTTSIVKDGKTSLSRFSFKTDEQNDSVIPVPDIERLLGTLKYHGDIVTLSLNDEKVKVKSKNKQTTLAGGMQSKAYANSKDSLLEFNEQALKRAEQIDGNTYILADGGKISSFFKVELPASELHDALKCDGMNGQKLNRYTFECTGDALKVVVGDVFKGQTECVLGDDYACDEFNATFEGGLENIFKHYSGSVTLSFLDFTQYKQGIRMIMQFENGDWVFQAGVL